MTSSDTAACEVAAPDEKGASRGRARSRRRLWFEGGSSVQRWGYDLLGWAMISFAIGTLASAAIHAAAPTPAGRTLAAVAVWAGMLAPIVLALRRSRPRGLLRLRGVDILYGVVLGVSLRVCQGWLDQAAAGGVTPFPAYPTIDGALPASWWFGDLLAPVVISPVLEEFFFRAVLLIAIYSVARRALGGAVAGFVAVITTTGLFVVAHTLSGALAWDDAAAYTLVGLTCGLLVVLTGRIWGAVLTHAIFNASWVALATVGTLLA
ncbi:type II CAAX endopeptidase family protein [Microbacterium limosum]|uniref:Type II CAAX endopeptidase family protein n=1 Tax=Microbacterium limosum TaxID=3079935 RepID=A0AAU0MGB5_9MICO|nr:type II CAAX endopeptidase family protein [Microbacterium sp. Y20]WOQ69205.1 type II CAAX endopeptidase family protein [Microbacterium sp. Y20]